MLKSELILIGVVCQLFAFWKFSSIHFNYMFMLTFIWFNTKLLQWWFEARAGKYFFCRLILPFVIYWELTLTRRLGWAWYHLEWELLPGNPSFLSRVSEMLQYYECSTDCCEQARTKYIHWIMIDNI